MERWKQKSGLHFGAVFIVTSCIHRRASARQAEFCILGRELSVFQMLIHTYSAMVSWRKNKTCFPFCFVFFRRRKVYFKWKYSWKKLVKIRVESVLRKCVKHANVLKNVYFREFKDSKITNACECVHLFISHSFRCVQLICFFVWLTV